MRSHSRAYEVLLRLYPRPFRDEFASEMELLFDEQLDDARRDGYLAVAALWVRTCVDLVVTVPQHHVRRERKVPDAVLAAQPIARGDIDFAHERRRWRIAAVLPPLWLWLVTVAMPGLMDPLFSNPPAIAGLPMGLYLVAVSILLTIGSSLVIATARSGIQVAAAIVLFVVPATLLILLGGSAILLITAIAA